MRTGSRESLNEIHRLAHALASSGTAMGYNKLGELASIIDIALLPAVEADDKIDTELSEVIREYLTALKKIDFDQLKEDEQQDNSANSSELTAHEWSEQNANVFLLEGDSKIAADLAEQVSHFGYRVKLFTHFADLFTALQNDANPEVLLMSVTIPGVNITAADAAQKLRVISRDDLPIVFLSDYDDIEHRLSAAVSGADAYFVKPVDVHELLDQLDKLTNETKVDPLHIVIVEDSATQSLYYSSILERAGMETTVVNNPMEILSVMADVSADMILMDMYMPKCNGMQMAKVIRQFPAYASIPIVFLSAETEIERQLDALSLGADDFLTKPINPPHLVRSVAIRAERARILRTFMTTDNLTGLLNHTRIKEQLAHEVARAERKGTPLSFAMIDIDHFKSVNDTHGHPVGDRVIKNLARVLQQRLRRSDSIGRYGGEEFAVVLPDADPALAHSIIDEIRANFSVIRQHSVKGDFSVSFSCGISSYPLISDATTIALEADKALYVAKGKGRNCVVRADLAAAKKDGETESN